MLDGTALSSLLNQALDSKANAARAEKARDTVVHSPVPFKQPAALVLLTAVFTCDNCKRSWPSPQPQLMIRYHNPEHKSVAQYSKEAVQKFTHLPRESKRVEYTAFFCEACFGAETEVTVTAKVCAPASMLEPEREALTAGERPIESNSNLMPACQSKPAAHKCYLFKKQPCHIYSNCLKKGCARGHR